MTCERPNSCFLSRSAGSAQISLQIRGTPSSAFPCHPQRRNICTSKKKVRLCRYTKSWQRVLSCQKEDRTEPYDKFRSIYEQISLVNMTGNQQSVNICYYLLITLPDKFMATDCWHIHLKIYFPQLTGYSLELRSTPFVNVKLESRRQLY